MFFVSMPRKRRTKHATKKAATGGPATAVLALVQQMAVVKSVLDKAPVDLKNLSNQCLLLSIILDSLVASNQKPDCRHDLLPLVQQVCQYKDHLETRPALLILLLSIKNAFRTDWLSTLGITGNDEISTTLNLLFDSFTTLENSAQTALQPLQSGGSAVKESQESMDHLVSISDRFYPRLQLKAVFVAVQAKAGYEVLMCDFHVPYMQIRDRVRLYVGKTDSIETATCIITPPQVNILVNGQQVEKRVATGNLVCRSAEPYVIAVASVRTIERSAKSTHLEDYIAPIKAASSEVDPTEVDDEVVEGAARLSLRCPISHQRLATPVKGTTCRHLQCFDFDNFLEINEKRPAWRCPCCNCFVSWPDLRIDRQMEKVLKETDEKVHEVLFSQDGSWAPVSTDENQSNSGPDVIPVEGREVGSEVIDLSHIADGELNGIRQDSNEIQLPDRKPDKQTLQAITESRGNSERTTVEQPGAISRNDGMTVNTNGDVLDPPAPLTLRNYNSQANYSQSHIGPVNGYRTATYLQQRQGGQQSPGITPQPTPHQQYTVPSQTQQQWRGPGVHPHQLVTNAAQTHNFQISQQFYIHDSTSIPVSHSPHQTAGRGINSQQISGTWGGPPAEQRPGGSAALEQHWRPASIRMRGSVANPSLGHNALGAGRLDLQQRFTEPQYSDSVPQGFNSTQVNAGQFNVRMHTPSFRRGPRG